MPKYKLIIEKYLPPADPDKYGSWTEILKQELQEEVTQEWLIKVIKAINDIP